MDCEYHINFWGIYYNIKTHNMVVLGIVSIVEILVMSDFANFQYHQPLVHVGTNSEFLDLG